MTYVPQEYPKMVPGPDGPTVVQNEAEEVVVISARIKALRCELPIAVDAAAWEWARKTSQHDWVAALYRPYMSPI